MNRKETTWTTTTTMATLIPIMRINHSGNDTESHMLKDSLENSRKQGSFEDSCILWNDYTNIKFMGKMSEALFIKELRPSLNTQETCVSLFLYNNWPTLPFYLYLFTNIYQCLYLFFVCANFNCCFPVPNQQCSFIIQLFFADCDAALLVLDS